MKNVATKSVTRVHFTVDPEGLTRIIRDMWAEGGYEKALNVLDKVSADEPIPASQQYDVLRGKLKFANHRGNPNRFCLVADDWKPRDPDNYPDPAPSKLAAHLKRKADREARLEISHSSRGRVMEEDDSDDAEPQRLPKMFGGYGSLEEMNMAFALKRSLPTPEEYLADLHSRDEREGKKPKADKSLTADQGWITPDGKFYACLTKMEHIWLASQFGLSERQAEESGWVKISRDFLGATFIHRGKTDATQKQINCVFDWCEKHGVGLPEFAGGKEQS